jgi:glycosyltransferase involved in cell wall biosynthesis
MTVGAIIAISLAALALTYWCVVLFTLTILLPKVLRARDGLTLSPPPTWPKLSIIVPAHNEQRVIETCTRTLLGSDYPNFDVLFVLDRCTDQTRELLRPFEAKDPRVRVFENTSCPPDWAGKCNAARAGAALVDGEYVLFTDADVEFDPTVVRAAMLIMLHQRRGLVSLLPTLTANTWYERLVQPAAVMGLLRLYPIDKVNRDSDRRPFANGQFLLFNRSIYDAVGGHAAVKDDLLEDIAFARVIENHGSRGTLAVADGMLIVNMYGTFFAMREGWKRIYIEACKRKVVRLRMHAIRIGLVAIGGPVAQLAALVLGSLAGGLYALGALAVVLAGMVVQGIVLWILYSQNRSPKIGILAYPLGGAIVAKAFWDGASDLANGRPIRWGGKEYVLAPRD